MVIVSGGYGLVCWLFGVIGGWFDCCFWFVVLVVSAVCLVCL